MRRDADADAGIILVFCKQRLRVADDVLDARIAEPPLSLFGDAARDLPYVECDPNGVNARPDLCEKAGVKAFPTWVIAGQRREGVLSLSALADASNFRPSTATAPSK